MLDRYWFAAPIALADEAPVPVVAVDTEEYRAGGAANVALNIKKLDGDVTILAPLGEDDFGIALAKILDAAGVRQNWLYDSRINTITKHRILSSKQQLLRVDFEQQYIPIDLDENSKQLIVEHDVIICSDYDKGALDKVEKIIAYAADLGKIILVDPKGYNYTKYRGATIITPNYKEFTDVVGSIIDKKDFATKAYNLINKLELEYLLVTCGADGMRLFGRDGYEYSASSYAQQVYDVTGAGDTVLASLAVSLANKEEFGMAIERASHAAALVVSQVGTGTVTKDEIDQQMVSYYDELSNKKLDINNKIIITDHIENLEYIDNLSKDYELYIFTLDDPNDHIITSNRIADLLKLNSDNICLIFNNKLNITHSIYNTEQILYMLSKIAVVKKIVYSTNSNVDLSSLIMERMV